MGEASTSSTSDANPPPPPPPTTQYPSLVISNIANLIPVKLDASNYLVWKALFEPILRGHRLMSFIDGTSTSPAESDPAFGAWYEKDQMLLSWINATLSTSALPHTVGVKTSKQAWENLKRRFGSSNPSHVMTLKKQLHTTKKGSLPMQDYIQKFKFIAYQLAACNSPIKDDDLIHHIMTGLPSSFRPFQSSVQDRLNFAPLTIEEFHNLLICEDISLTEDTSSSTGHELEDIAIQVRNDVAARVEKTNGDHELTTQIPRLPESLRQGANGGYDPQVISIGPYHWGKPRLEAMEKHKSRCLGEFLDRFPGCCLVDYIKEIELLELRLRSCYDKDIHMTSKNFVEMMLVDGCFLVESSLKEWERALNYGVDESREDNPRPSLLFSIINYHDMRLFENQLPFFLLQRIYDIAITKGNQAWPSSFIQVALKFCLSTMRSEGREHLDTPITLQYQLPKPIHHFMHLRHSLKYSSYSAQQPTLQTHSSESSSSSESSCSAICMRLCHKVTFGVFATSEKAVDLIVIPSATELHDLGIKFKVSESRNYHIKFHGGIMEISRIMLSNWTTGDILNMVAFERFHFEVEPFYIPFFMFIDLMVNTANDVALLRRYRIIDHDFGSDEEVALFFNQLMKGILKDLPIRSIEMSNEVNKYCSIKRHRWRASLIRDYCSSPWSTLGLVVGFILLALTFVQSYMSLHSYFRPPHS